MINKKKKSLTKIVQSNFNRKPSVSKTINFEPAAGHRLTGGRFVLALHLHLQILPSCVRQFTLAITLSVLIDLHKNRPDQLLGCCRDMAACCLCTSGRGEFFSHLFIRQVHRHHDSIAKHTSRSPLTLSCTRTRLPTDSALTRPI